MTGAKQGKGEQPEREPHRAEVPPEPGWERLGRGGPGRRDVDPLFRLLVENARDLIYRYRFLPEPGFEYVSPAAKAMTGYTQEEFYHDPDLFHNLIHPSDRGEFETVVRARAARRRPVALRWVRKDGGVLWVETQFEQVRDGQGNLVAVEGVARNVSEHRLAEAAVRQYSRMLSDAERIAHLGSWEWNVDRDLMSWSQELCAIHGIPRDEFGATYSAFLERVHPEDRPRVDAEIRAALKDQRPFHILHRILRSDGQVRHVEARGDSLREDGGDAVRVVGTVQDVTEARLSKDRFRTLLEAAPDAMLVVDGAGRINLLNAQAEELFGYQPGELVGKQVEELVPEALRGDHLKHRKEFMEHPRRRPMGAALELKGRRKDGSEVPVEISLSPVPGDPGPQVVATVRDVTERRRIEQERREAQARLEEVERLKALDELKSDFITMAAHELGNPITPIQLQLHMLKALRPTLDAQGQASLDVLDRNVDRLAGLIGDLLLAARHQTHRLGITKEPVDLVALVREAVDAYQDEAKKAGIRIEVEAPEDLELRADRGRIGEVLDNLLSNAIKYAGGTRFVSVQVRQDGELAYVRVRDSGIGFDDEQAAHLFRPFSRVHDEQAGRPGGTGLGLYICQALVELHGGRIWAESDGPGKGSTFTFGLPLTANAVATAPLQILVVEDSKADFVLLEAALGEGKVACQLHHVLDGEDAIQFLDRQGPYKEAPRPDLLFLDINLPRKSGYDVLSHMRKNPALADIPVFMLTASDAEKDLRKSYDMQATAFLTKPLDTDRLRLLLESMRLR
jgi:PAS domain S-box-containing protein